VRLSLAFVGTAPVPANLLRSVPEEGRLKRFFFADRIAGLVFCARRVHRARIAAPENNHETVMFFFPVKQRFCGRVVGFRAVVSKSEQRATGPKTRRGEPATQRQISARAASHSSAGPGTIAGHCSLLTSIFVNGWRALGCLVCAVPPRFRRRKSPHSFGTNVWGWGGT